MVTVKLKKGREKPVREGHPWIFSGAIDTVEGKAEPGDPCTIASGNGEVLGKGYYNPASAICVRVLSLGSGPFGPAQLRDRLDCAIALRRRRFGADSSTTAYRLVNSEGDFLPGLIVDKYDKGLCVQVLTAGMERLQGPVLAQLDASLAPEFIFERSDTEARGREGLSAKQGTISGAPPETLTFIENGKRFCMDLMKSQKTGFYLDQRDNRRLVQDYAGGASVCDCFAYSGGFSVYALAGGARFVHAVDTSQSAVESARRNIALNGLPTEAQRFFVEDVFEYLRRTDMVYDLIILDPPKFARHPGEVPRAARGYKDINLLAIKKAAPGGIVFTFSCSGAVDPKLFRQIVFSAAADSGRSVEVLHVLGAGPDHPVNIAHREGDYLKGLALRVL